MAVFQALLFQSIYELAIAIALAANSILEIVSVDKITSDRQSSLSGIESRMTAKVIKEMLLHFKERYRHD